MLYLQTDHYCQIGGSTPRGAPVLRDAFHITLPSNARNNQIRKSWEHIVETQIKEIRCQDFR